MPLVYCGACSHAPGITGRAERADTQTRQALESAFRRMGDEMRATRPDALVVIAAEHFANFFMNNMPAFAIGMADSYEGPIEDEAFLRIGRTTVPGNKALSRRLIENVMQTVDVAYAEEWKFDHGISVPLHFLTPDYDLPIVPANINCQGPPLAPLARAWAFGEALRRAADAVPERIALIGTGGLSHWPAHAGLRKDQPGMGPRVPAPAGRPTTARRFCPTPTPKSIARPGRAASRSGRSSLLRLRRWARRDGSISASLSRSSRSTARSAAFGCLSPDRND